MKESQQETRMLSQALNRAMPRSPNQLEGVNRKKLIFYLAVQLYYTYWSSKPASALLFETVFDDRIVKFNMNRIF